MGELNANALAVAIVTSDPDTQSDYIRYNNRKDSLVYLIVTTCRTSGETTKTAARVVPWSRYYLVPAAIESVSQSTRLSPLLPIDTHDMILIHSYNCALNYTLEI